MWICNNCKKGNLCFFNNCFHMVLQWDFIRRSDFSNFLASTGRDLLVELCWHLLTRVLVLFMGILVLLPCMSTRPPFLGNWVSMRMMRKFLESYPSSFGPSPLSPYSSIYILYYQQMIMVKVGFLCLFVIILIENY